MMTIASSATPLIPEIGDPKRLIDYVNSYQQQEGLTDQELATRLDLVSVDVLKMLREGKLRFSFSTFFRLCTELQWNFHCGMRAMCAEQYLDVVDNLSAAIEPFTVTKNLEEVFDAFGNVKQGKLPFHKTVVDDVTVLMFKEPKQGK